MATCIHGTHWDGISRFFCAQCGVVGTSPNSPVMASPVVVEIEPSAKVDAVKRLADAIDDLVNHHTTGPGDPIRIPRHRSARVAEVVNELACEWANFAADVFKELSPGRDGRRET